MSRRKLPANRARTALSVVVLVALIAALLAVFGVPNPASAEEEISIAPDSVVRGEPGSIAQIAETQVPAELVGSSCVLSVVALNGSSTHLGNVLIVTTGDTRTQVPGVEDISDGSVVAEQTVALGTTITLEIQLGEEGVSSLGFTAGFDCPPAEPTVLPAQQLPQTPAAAPAVAEPTYTG